MFYEYKRPLDRGQTASHGTEGQYGGGACHGIELLNGCVIKVCVSPRRLAFPARYQRGESASCARSGHVVFSVSGLSLACLYVYVSLVRVLTELCARAGRFNTRVLVSASAAFPSIPNTPSAPRYRISSTYIFLLRLLALLHFLFEVSYPRAHTNTRTQTHCIQTHHHNTRVLRTLTLTRSHTTSRYTHTELRPHDAPLCVSSPSPALAA